MGESLSHANLRKPLKPRSALRAEKSSLTVSSAPRGAVPSDVGISAVMRRMHNAQAKVDRNYYLDHVNRKSVDSHGVYSTFQQ